MTGKHIVRAALFVLLIQTLARCDNTTTSPAATQSTTQPTTRPQDSTVRALVKQLDSPSPQQREKAMLQLLELGEAAHPLLRSIVESESQHLSAEQHTQIQVVLQSGPTLFLEKHSGLSAASLDTLHRLQKQGTDPNKAYEIFDTMESILGESAITDQGLALVVQTALKHAPSGTAPAQRVSGYRFTSLISQVTLHKAVGQATGKACGEWIRNTYVPALESPEKTELVVNSYEAQAVLMRLLVGDLLDEATFGAVFESYCKYAGKTRDSLRPSMAFNGRPFFIGFAWSRHCTARHISDLVRLLALQEDRIRCEASTLSTYLAASPCFNESHARALVSWFLLRSEPPPWCAGHLDEFMQRLTGATIEEPGQSDATHDINRADSLAVATRWRQWWEAHGDKLLGRPGPKPAYRYITVLFNASDPAKPAVTVLADLELQIGAGRLLHPEAQPGLAMLVQLSRSDPFNAGRPGPPARNDAPLYVDQWIFYRSNSNPARNPIFTGEVRVDAQTFHSLDYGHDRPAATFALTLLLDSGQAGRTPTREQVADPAYWEQVVLEAAIRSERAGTPADGSSHRPPTAPPLRFPISELNELRGPGLEGALRQLQNDASPVLTAAAGFQLAKWGVPIDADRMVQLLTAAEPRDACRAARALGLAGRSEGPRWLLDRARTQGAASPAWAALMGLAEGKGFDAPARNRLAAEIIKTLVPREEDTAHPAFREYLLARAWSGQDFNYQPGGDTQANAKALAQYHEWAAANGER